MNGKWLLPWSRPLAVAARVILMCSLVLGAGAPAVARAAPATPPLGCHDGQLGAQLIQICFPLNWNGTLIMYAHGYKAAQEPLALPTAELTIGGVYVPNLLMAQGFAFATSSLSRNGYAVMSAETDLNALMDYFAAQVPAGSLQKVLIGGASEGGLVTTMMTEKYPDRYRGGLAMCGPIGGTPYQVKTQGDFKVVFDYFFPDVFDFGVVDVPPDAWQNWDAYEASITAALAADPSAREQLFAVTGVARDPADPAGSAAMSAGASLWYNVWASNDLFVTAGGNPYGNRVTLYRGSLNDLALNRGVERVSADPAALAWVRTWYQPSGHLQNPLVTLHTTLDPVVPYSHERIYAARALLAGSASNLTVLPVQRYGHCAFELNEILAGFGWLLLRTGATVPDAWAAAMAEVQPLPSAGR